MLQLTVGAPLLNKYADSESTESAGLKHQGCR